MDQKSVLRVRITRYFSVNCIPSADSFCVFFYFFVFFYIIYKIIFIKYISEAKSDVMWKMQLAHDLAWFLRDIMGS